DVGWHEVGRELHPVGVEPQHPSERIDEKRLGEARRADEQRVTAGKNGDEGFLHHEFLAENRLPDGGARGGESVERNFRLFLDLRLGKVAQFETRYGTWVGPEGGFGIHALMSPVAAVNDCRAGAFTIGLLIFEKNPIKVAAFHW